MFRPRSIVRLIMVSFVVVLTPLIAAVVTAVVQVDRLSQLSRAALIEAEIATQQSRVLAEQLREMRRAIGQYGILREEAAYRDYVDHRTRFRTAIENLSELELTTLGREHLAVLATGEQALYDELHHSMDVPVENIRDVTEAAPWTPLTNHADAVLAESSRLIEEQVNYTSGTASDVQRTLLLQAAAVIPATIVLAGMFVVMITRPMREVGRAIRRLGSREFAEPIEVQGPRDVEQIGRELDWLRVRIQELEHQKLTFLRHISHELKTPLTTIREGAELLLESLGDSRREEAEISRILCTNSVQLQKLIEDLLQFGKTQELVTDLKIADNVPVRDIVAEVAEAHGLASTAKSVVLDLRLLPVAVRGDRNKIRIVADNLLANAIKYTPPGGRVTVSLAAQEGYAMLDVSDTGPGVAEDERRKIFEPFQQGRAEYQSSVKGTGLGLAIAREYVEAHDGYIEVVDSEAGAHFRVALPLNGPTRATG